MAKLGRKIKKAVDFTIPEKNEIRKMKHATADYIMLIIRNILVSVSVILFLITFFIHGESNVIKAVAYFAGAGAYLLECLAITDFFRKKVENKEMFMIYCFGPLYVLMGIDYIIWH